LGRSEQAIENDHRTNQLGLFNFAEAYRQAGDILAVEHATVFRFGDPIRYLFCHSIELYLKAFLRQHGLTVGQIRDLSHGFAGLREACSERGLRLDEEDFSALELIAAKDNYIRARYIHTGLMTVATIEALSRTAASLAAAVGAVLKLAGLPLREIRRSPLKNSGSLTTPLSNEDRAIVEMADRLFDDDLT
jgi:hypothetical protein